MSRSRPQFEVMAAAVRQAPVEGITARTARYIIQNELGIPTLPGHVYKLFSSDYKLQREYQLRLIDGWVRLRGKAMVERLEQEKVASTEAKSVPPAQT